MSMFTGVSRARRAVFCAAMVGLGLGVMSAPVVAEEAAATEEEAKPLLMGQLEKTDFGKKMTELGLTLDGYAQGSWTHSFDNPPGNIIDGRGFDFENDDLTLNGIALDFHRDIEATSDKFDIGFGLDMLYGSDARFTKSNGMFDNNGFAFDGEGDGPTNQFDVTQAFVTFGIPVGKGLLVTAGKFVTPIGYEYVDPRKNTLYSHSYLFNFAAPFSQTGVMGKYQFGDTLAVSAGITRGWDQSTEDNNGKLDFLSTVEYTPAEEWSYTFTLSTGPQSNDPDGWQTTLDLLATYTLNEKWSFGGEALLGWQADIPGADDAFWYGVAVYPSYQVCPGFSVNSRAEWFADPDDSRGVGADNVFEITLGVAIQPLVKTEWGKALTIRPEVRWDFADEDVFNAGADDQQVTFAIDAVFAF